MSDYEIEDAVGLVLHYQTIMETVTSSARGSELVTTYHCWLAIGQDGPKVFERKYADQGSLDSTHENCRYSMTYDAEVGDLDEAKFIFKEYVAYWMRRLFKS